MDQVQQGFNTMHCFNIMHMLHGNNRHVCVVPANLAFSQALDHSRHPQLLIVVMTAQQLRLEAKVVEQFPCMPAGTFAKILGRI